MASSGRKREGSRRQALPVNRAVALCAGRAGRRLAGMLLHRLLLGIDALIALVFAWFFLEGLGDGTVSAGNGLLWFAILAGLAAVLTGGVALHRAGHSGWAKLLLLVPALPALGFAFLALLFILSGARWQ
jgi:hypothetical protein